MQPREKETYKAIMKSVKSLHKQVKLFAKAQLLAHTHTQKKKKKKKTQQAPE